MSTVAVPVWEGRVSPVFDAASHAVVTDVRRIEVGPLREVRLGESQSKAAQLEALGIEVLLCGGISNQQLEEMAAHGIRVLRHVCGPAQAVLKAYAENRLQEQQFTMPGCHCRQRACHSSRRRNRGGS